jgi:cytochrome c biogenesis protein CcmG, thiol:disulfide interchange protein DsbE
MIRRLLPFAAFLVLALLLWAGVRMNSGKDTSAIPSPFIGKPVPAFRLPVLGEPTRMLTDRDLRGRPYLLNVWGSWCVNCREEHAQLTALSQRGVRVVGYNYKDAPQDAQRWLAEFGNPYEPVLADEEGRVALDFGIYGAPESFLVDAQGVIRWKLVGPITPDVLAAEVEPRLKAIGALR